MYRFEIIYRIDLVLLLPLLDSLESFSIAVSSAPSGAGSRPTHGLLGHHLEIVEAVSGRRLVKRENAH